MFKTNIGFKQEFSFEYRLNESNRVLNKYPDRKPIICEKFGSQKDLPDIDKKKYLVPDELTVGQFIYVIRKRIRLNPEAALFLFVNNKIVSSSYLISQLYHNEKDPDGFLYIQYSKENVFG
jgi:GABA(A) receptor-associated protein